MHDAILFISDEPADIDISTDFMSPEDIGMGGIADYIGEKLSIPETIAGVKVNSDGSFVLTRQDIEAFFKRRFFELKRMVTDQVVLTVGYDIETNFALMIFTISNTQ